MLITRYVLDGVHTKSDITAEFFLAEYRKFQEKQLTNPTRLEISPIFFTEITSSDAFKHYVENKDKKRGFIAEINGLDLVIDPSLSYEHHRLVMEKTSF